MKQAGDDRKSMVSGRRRALKAMLGVAAAPVFAGLVSPGSASAAAIIDTDEFATLAGIVHTIIPTDDTAGAYETQTALFVWYMIQKKGDKVVLGVKQALAGVNHIALALFGRPSAALAESEKESVVSVVATNTQLAPFWENVRSLTVFHYYAQPDGYRPLGLPGPSIDRGGYPYADSNPLTCIAA